LLNKPFTSGKGTEINCWSDRHDRELRGHLTTLTARKDELPIRVEASDA